MSCREEEPAAAKTKEMPAVIAVVEAEEIQGSNGEEDEEGDEEGSRSLETCTSIEFILPRKPKPPLRFPPGRSIRAEEDLLAPACHGE